MLLRGFPRGRFFNVHRCVVSTRAVLSLVASPLSFVGCGLAHWPWSLDTSHSTQCARILLSLVQISWQEITLSRVGLWRGAVAIYLRRCAWLRIGVAFSSTFVTPFFNTPVLDRCNGDP